ncbi:MAG: EamA family transporter [Syntrophales bacterium]|nr:EamA family transporter [Syntrophales bacterium]MDD5233687.1 EamA family transporter [Syntrophales bacterium]
MIRRIEHLSTPGLLHLLVVYTVWSSTYLAIRVAVREGSGFPPFIMAGSRMLVAGLILIGICLLRKDRIRITRRELYVASFSGVMLWVGSNGLITWAEQSVGSGITALLVSTIPIWTALTESALVREKPSLRLMLYLLLGFAGVGFLLAPGAGGFANQFVAAAALVLASINWSIGSVFQARRPLDLSGFAVSAYQHLSSAAVLILISLVLGEPAPAPIPEAWAAWGYLILFGSVLAFTSYVMTLRLLPVDIVMTFAYVNPVLAVVLGWLVLGEPLSWNIAAGAAMIILAVMGVFRTELRKGIEAEKPSD